VSASVMMLGGFFVVIQDGIRIFHAIGMVLSVG